MKCHQCERPAFYQYEDQVSLCLRCAAIFDENRYRAFLMNASMFNQALDDMDTATGMYSGEGRIPVAALANAMERSVTNNHIRISNSSVGVLNTGDLAKINAVVTITEGSDAEELGRCIRDFAQAVAESAELTRENKQEIGELLSALSEQIAGKRSRPVVRSLLKELGERVHSVNTLWGFCERIGKFLMDLGITG